jgi:Tfp pilus assembly protein PilF
MKRWVAVLLIAAAWSHGFGDPTQGLPQSAVVSLFRYDKDGQLSTRGSGFFVAADGYIATARHVVQDSSKVTVQLSDGSHITVAGVVAEDPVHDVAIVRIAGAGYPYLRLGSFDNVETDEVVRVICDPFGFHGKVITGTVDRVEDLADDYQWWDINADSEEGESGSPLVDASGAVVGLIRGEMNDHAKGWIVSVDSIKQLMLTATNTDPQPVSEMSHRKYMELYDDPNFQPALQAAYDGENLEAARRMALVIANFPRSATVYALLGSYDSRLRYWKNAGDAFERALAIRPDYTFAMASLGMVLYYRGEQGEALAMTNKAMQLASAQQTEFTDTWLNIGGAYILLRHREGARKVIERLRGFKSKDADGCADELTRALKYGSQVEGR